MQRVSVNEDSMKFDMLIYGYTNTPIVCVLYSKLLAIPEKLITYFCGRLRNYQFMLCTKFMRQR